MITYRIFFIVGIISVMGLFIPNTSFAVHKSDEVVWQLVVVSAYPACGNNHYYMVAKYSDITEMYLDLYQMPNKAYKPICMIESDFKTNYETPDEVDLIIIVYDRNIGRAKLHTQEVGGFYSHIGDEWTHNHSIVFCDCSNFYYSDPVWILSHELSHFILNYLGFDIAIAEKQIHALDAKYDYCVEVQYDESCLSIKTRLKGEHASWTVMAPYEPAIGKKIISHHIDAKVFDLESNKEIISEITSRWLDGTISDKKYAKSLKTLYENINTKEKNTSFFSEESPYYILTEPPKEKKVGLSDDVAYNSQKEKAEIVAYMIPSIKEFQWPTSEDKNEQEIHPSFKSRAQAWIDGLSDGKVASNWLKEKAEIVVYMIPSIKEFQGPTSEDKNEQEIPTWFKSRAQAWKDGRIPDPYFERALVRLTHS